MLNWAVMFLIVAADRCSLGIQGRGGDGGVDGSSAVRRLPGSVPGIARRGTSNVAHSSGLSDEAALTRPVVTRGGTRDAIGRLSDPARKERGAEGGTGIPVTYMTRGTSISQGGMEIMNAPISPRHLRGP